MPNIWSGRMETELKQSTNAFWVRRLLLTKRSFQILISPKKELTLSLALILTKLIPPNILGWLWSSCLLYLMVILKQKETSTSIMILWLKICTAINWLQKELFTIIWNVIVFSHTLWDSTEITCLSIISLFKVQISLGSKRERCNRKGEAAKIWSNRKQNAR